MVDISDKDTDKDSADKQAEVAEKEDQNYLISVQDEIISIFSERRNHVDQHFRSVDMADPETMNHPNVKLFTKEVYRLINEEEDKNKKLFQASPPKEDCPICMLPMPFCGELDGHKNSARDLTVCPSFSKMGVSRTNTIIFIDVSVHTFPKWAWAS